MSFDLPSPDFELMAFTNGLLRMVTVGILRRVLAWERGEVGADARAASYSTIKREGRRQAECGEGVATCLGRLVHDESNQGRVLLAIEAGAHRFRLLQRIGDGLRAEDGAESRSRLPEKPGQLLPIS